MNRLQLYLCLLLLTAISLAWSLRTIFVAAQSSPSSETARGKYLVEEVARRSEYRAEPARGEQREHCDIPAKEKAGIRLALPPLH